MALAPYGHRGARARHTLGRLAALGPGPLSRGLSRWYTIHSVGSSEIEAGPLRLTPGLGDCRAMYWLDSEWHIAPVMQCSFSGPIREHCRNMEGCDMAQGVPLSNPNHKHCRDVKRREGGRGGTLRQYVGSSHPALAGGREARRGGEDRPAQARRLRQERRTATRTAQADQAVQVECWAKGAATAADTAEGGSWDGGPVGPETRRRRPGMPIGRNPVGCEWGGGSAATSPISRQTSRLEVRTPPAGGRRQTATSTSSAPQPSAVRRAALSGIVGTARSDKKKQSSHKQQSVPNSHRRRLSIARSLSQKLTQNDGPVPSP